MMFSVCFSKGKFAHNDQQWRGGTGRVRAAGQRQLQRRGFRRDQLVLAGEHLGQPDLVRCDQRQRVIGQVVQRHADLEREQ